MANILGIAGSLRAKSNSTRLLSMALAHAAQHGAETRLVRLADSNLPLVNPDDEDENEHYDTMRAHLLWADAFIISSPDYHGSMSGTVKNFFDHYWKEFTGKLFAFIVSSHEKGLTVQDQLRTAVRQCYGWSLPYGIGFNGDESFDGEGGLTDERLARRVTMLGRDVAVYGGLLHSQFQTDLARQPRDPGFAKDFKPLA